MKIELVINAPTLLVDLSVDAMMATTTLQPQNPAMVSLNLNFQTNNNRV